MRRTGRRLAVGLGIQQGHGIELRALLRAIRHKFQVRTKFFVFLGEPFQECHRFFRLFHLCACGFVEEFFAIFLLFLAGVNNDFL